MPPEPGSPDSWMRVARSDLALARQRPGLDVLPEALCFHAQQAAEKALKAVLIHFGVPAPRTHSIERLVGLLPTSIERGPPGCGPQDARSGAGRIHLRPEAL